ncbi:MAG: hypothetical protein ACE5KM_01510 [Planctomycetaceae bacterium]
MRLLLIGFTAILLSFVGSSNARACPACGTVLEPTLSERFAGSDAAVLAKWVSARRASEDGKQPPQTMLDILQIARGGGLGLKKGGRIAVPFFVNSEAGTPFFLTAKKPASSGKTAGVRWSVPKELSETAYFYITQAPSPEVPAVKRLRFFRKFLEFPDSLVADDAYNEFAKAEFKHIKAIADSFSRKKLRRWLRDKKTPQTHIGLYGIMLGLCGTKADLPLLEKTLRHTKSEFRMGIEGIISGYVLIAGDKGLDLIDRVKLRDKTAPVGEVFMAMQALRILWTYGEGKVSHARLKRSMRIVLDRTDYGELMLADLARWKDWEVMGRVVKMYGRKGAGLRGFKIAAIRYLMAAVKDVPQTGGKPGPHVAKARAHLETIKKTDPKMYRAAVRMLL